MTWKEKEEEEEGKQERMRKEGAQREGMLEKKSMEEHQWHPDNVFMQQPWCMVPAGSLA